MTPSGTIPWSRLSRLSDSEMKKLMIEVVDHCYNFLTLMTKDGFREILQALSKYDVQPDWHDPPYRDSRPTANDY